MHTIYIGYDVRIFVIVSFCLTLSKVRVIFGGIIRLNQVRAVCFYFQMQLDGQMDGNVYVYI